MFYFKQYFTHKATLIWYEIPYREITANFHCNEACYGYTYKEEDLFITICSKTVEITGIPVYVYIIHFQALAQHTRQKQQAS